jgi:hypothetical protein
MSADRAAAILARFNAAHNYLIGALRGLSPALAERRPADGAWNAAQIGCHVAMANDWTADVLTGSTPIAAPCPSGFAERFDANAVPWSTKTFPLDPPDIISTDNAVERLKASGHHLSRAIASLTPERGSSYCVSLPFGTLSLFELAEYAAAHAARHSEQLGVSVQKAY